MHIQVERLVILQDLELMIQELSDTKKAPESPEVYVHRTGRTGRAGKAGVAISLVSGLDIGNFKFMQTVTKLSRLCADG